VDSYFDFVKISKLHKSKQTKFADMYARSHNGYAVRTQDTEADERLRKHAQHVLGVPIFFNALMAWDCIPLLPSTAPRLRTSTKETRQCAAMLMPRDGELFAIYIDGRHGIFVQAQDDPDSLHVLDGRWAGLCQIMPPDSACLAVVYRTLSQELVMGVYDVRRVATEDVSTLPVFERQRVLHELFCKAQRIAGIERHWVGHEHSLLEYVQESKNLAHVPFEVANMLRLQDGEQGVDKFSGTPLPEYQIVLRPLVLPQSSASAGKDAIITTSAC